MLEILAIFEWQYQHRIFLGGGGYLYAASAFVIQHQKNEIFDRMQPEPGNTARLSTACLYL